MTAGFSVFYGPLVSSIDPHSYKALPRALFSVDNVGFIAWLVEDVPAHELQNQLAAKGCSESELIALHSGEFIMPGFIDTHTVSVTSYCRF